MSAVELRGRKIADAIREQARGDIAALAREGRVPHLVSLVVGDNAPAQIYIKNQKSSCEDVGIQYSLYHFDGRTSERMLDSHIQALNQNPEVSGIIVQLPLPEGVNARALHNRIDPKKDVEGVNLANLGRLFYRTPALVPCTAMGALELIRSTGVELRGAEAVIVGHSEIVGKPLALLLMNELATATVCHIGTRDLAEHTRRADILVVAAGRAGLIAADMVKAGAIVIDVGINQVHAHDEQGQRLVDSRGQPQMKTVGDVDYEAVRKIAGYITPVPGGVGPLTVAMLIRNTVATCQASRA